MHVWWERLIWYPATDALNRAFEIESQPLLLPCQKFLRGPAGIDWKDYGKGLRKCHLNGYRLSSKLEKSVTNAHGNRMDVYKLRLSWNDGWFCFTKKRVFEVTVVNIRTWDQAPALLSSPQVSALCDAVLDMKQAQSYVFIHCAGGIGRTGNLAMGLSEILCENTPSGPFHKLHWLRENRPGCVQASEQLLDGIVLSYMILEDLLAKAKARMAKTA